MSKHPKGISSTYDFVSHEFHLCDLNSYRQWNVGAWEKFCHGMLHNTWGTNYPGSVRYLEYIFLSLKIKIILQMRKSGVLWWLYDIEETDEGCVMLSNAKASLLSNTWRCSIRHCSSKYLPVTQLETSPTESPTRMTAMYKMVHDLVQQLLRKHGNVIKILSTTISQYQSSIN